MTVQSGAAAAADYAVNQSFLGRIAPSSSGTVALSVASSSNLDFSAAGANLSGASLGATTAVTYSGTLTPNGNTFRLGGGGGALTMASALGGNNNLSVCGSGSGGTVILSAANTYIGTTTVNAGTLQVTGSVAGNGSNKVFVAQDADGVFGDGVGNASIVRRVAASGTYAGLGSAITNLGPGGLVTTADILDGNASAQADVSMAWRTRTAAEKTQAGGGLVGEVLNLDGVAPSGTGTQNGSHQTDALVLQMSYDPASLLSISGLTESQAAAQGQLCLGYLDLGPGGVVGSAANQWVNAVTGNFGGTPNFVGNEPYSSSYFVLGDYGVNMTDHMVWAVVDHNSEFAATVVPEPGTFALLGAGAIGLVGWAWRRRKPIASAT